jgi:hypothetical protein
MLSSVVETARQSCFGYPIFGTLEIPTTLTRLQFIDYCEEENKVREKKRKKNTICKNFT